MGEDWYRLHAGKNGFSRAIGKSNPSARSGRNVSVGACREVGEDKAPPKRKLPWNKANDIDLGADKDGSLISDAGTYDKATHGGKTKMQRLQEPGALGWQVYVVDGGDGVPGNDAREKSR